MTGAQETHSVNRLRRRMSNLLAVWSIGSIVAAFLIFIGAQRCDSAVRALGEALAVQNVIWGTIDLMIAIAGMLQLRRAHRIPTDAIVQIDETHKLVSVLRFNTKLNWFWLACGVVLLASGVLSGARSSTGASLAGHGVGVLIQGGFLFWFDRRFLSRLSKWLSDHNEGGPQGG